jgi:hypothetical protein
MRKKRPSSPATTGYYLRIRDFLFFVILPTSLTLSSLFPPSDCHAERRPLSEISVVTPHYSPSATITPRRGLFEYDVEWEGIPVASASIEITDHSSFTKIETQAKSAKLIDLLYKLRYLAKGEFERTALTPITTHIDHRENSKQRLTNITFLPDGMINSVIAKVNKGEQSTYSFKSENQTFDPFSSAVMAQSLPWDVGQSRKFDVFDGKNRYVITLQCIKKATRYILGKKTPVLIFEPKVFDENNNTKAAKLRRATITFTDDQFRDLVELDSEVFIGSIKASISSYSPVS